MSSGQSFTHSQSMAGASFEEVVVPHLHAARRLARGLMRNHHDAEDAVQDASLRALRYFRTFAGGSGRAWFLQIVRNTCYSWNDRLVERLSDPLDQEEHDASSTAPNPEALLLQTDDATLVERAMRRLPDRFRDLLVLRELQGLSYRELTGVTGMPLGSVMSGLSRARQAFRGALTNELKRCSESAVGASAIPAGQPSRFEREGEGRQW